MTKAIAIIGNHTDAGKTVASAIICEALEADYWKPIQAGNLSASDTLSVKSLLSNTVSICHPEAIRLTEPLSPHAAAKIDKVSVLLSSFSLPTTTNLLIVETAGGLLSPVNDEHTNLDLIKWLNIPVILVSQHYLGSINHTLLTASILNQENIPVKGILFNGEANPASESFIQNYTQLPIIGRIPLINPLHKDGIKHAAHQLINPLTQALL